jgi:fucose permease
LISGKPWNAGYRTIGIIQFCLVVLLCAALPLWKGKTSGGNAEHPAPASLKNLLRIPGVKQALAAFFCYCTIEWITGLWGSSYLVTVKNIPPEIAARWIALYFIGITSGRFLSGFATMKLSSKQMIRIGQILVGGGVIVLALPLGNVPLLPGLFLIGLGCAPIFPSLLHETPKNFGSAHSQAIMGLQMASAYIGSTLMPPLFGQLASFTGFSIFPVFIGIILIVKVIMIETLHQKTASNSA